MKNENGFLLLQVIVAVSVFSILALTVGNLIVDQKRAVVALEDQLEKIQLMRNVETILKDGISCQETLKGFTLSNSESKKNFDALKDNLGNPLYTSNTRVGSLEIGQMYMSNSTVTGPDSYGFVDVTIPISRTRTPSGELLSIKPYKTKISITTNSDGEISSCSVPDSHFLGGGTVHMSGNSNVVCKPISFREGFTELEVMLVGNLYYPPGATYDWGQWSVSFSNVDYSQGRGQVCIDSGGFCAGDPNCVIGAEWVKWMAYRR